MIKKLAVIPVITLLITHSAMAATRHFNARNDAMGGVGVASAVDNGALLANPALIAKTEQFSLVIPAGGIQFADKNNLLGEIKKIGNTAARYNIPTWIGRGDQHLKKLAGELRSSLENLRRGEHECSLSGGVSASAVIPFEEITGCMGIFVGTHGDSSVQAAVDKRDLALLGKIEQGAIFPRRIDLQANIYSEGRALAAWVTDYGVSFASTFEVVDRPLHIGISPKLQAIKLYNYSFHVNQFQPFKDSKFKNFQSQQTKFNLDLGIAADFSEQLTVGLAGKNLLNPQLETKTINKKSFTYRMAPVVTLGSAYCWEQLIAAAEIDLTPVKAFSNQQESQYAGIGAEWEALSWAKLRAGYRVDIKKSRANLATVGLGLHSRKLNFDFAAMVGKMTWGAALQLNVAT